MSEFGNISFDLPKNQSNVIKVIGVGGGGSNAVNHMYTQGINGVDFVVCNTDAQALQTSPIPTKIQLGLTLTEGLGAGANPDVGEHAAKESIEEIREMFEKCGLEIISEKVLPVEDLPMCEIEHKKITINYSAIVKRA